MEAKNWQNFGIKTKSVKCFCISYNWAWETNATAKQTIEKIWRKIRAGLMFHIISYIIKGDPQLDISP